jgi:hypothetical protein
LPVPDASPAIKLHAPSEAGKSMPPCIRVSAFPVASGWLS